MNGSWSEGLNFESSGAIDVSIFWQLKRRLLNSPDAMWQGHGRGMSPRAEGIFQGIMYLPTWVAMPYMEECMKRVITSFWAQAKHPPILVPLRRSRKYPQVWNHPIWKPWRGCAVGLKTSSSPHWMFKLLFNKICWYIKTLLGHLQAHKGSSWSGFCQAA